MVIHLGKGDQDKVRKHASPNISTAYKNIQTPDNYLLSNTVSFLPIKMQLPFKRESLFSLEWRIESIC